MSKTTVTDTNHFRVRNFEKFQHYHDRRPPWIKLYRDLWDDPRFFELSEADRYCLVSIFVLASQHENQVSTNQKWLKAQLLMTRPIPLQMLIATGWLEYAEQDASELLAASNVIPGSYPSRARGETETEVQRQNTETEIYIAHGEFKNAKLTEEQHGKLKAELNGNLDSYIARFDRWVQEAPKARDRSGVCRKDRNAYLSIGNWYRKDVAEGKVKAASNGKPTEAEIQAAADRLRANREQRPRA